MEVRPPQTPRTGPTSAISLYLPSMEVRRSTGKCFRQWGGPGRERADCRGRGPSPPRSSATPRQPQLGGQTPRPAREGLTRDGTAVTQGMAGAR